MTAASSRSALLVIALAACSAPSDVDAGSDAPPDVPQDTPRDAPVDAPRDAGAPVLVEGPAFGEACAPWAGTADVVPRGLPSDSTPRVLWRWSPRDDPRWTALGGRALGIRDLARAPQGAIFVTVGSRLQSIALLTASGALEAVSAVGGLVGPVVALPDGGAVVASLDASEADLEGTASLVAFAADGSATGSRVDGGEARLHSPGDPVSIAVGPEGRVYFAAQNWVAASCHGEELVWRLIFPIEVRVGSLFTAPNGDVWVNDISLLGDALPIRVSPSGDASAPMAVPPPGGAELGARVGWFDDGLVMLAGDNGWDVALDLNEAGVEWSQIFPGAETDGGSPAFFDGAGGVWFIDVTAVRFRRWTRAGLAFDVPADSYPNIFGFLEDGSLLRGRVTVEPGAVPSVGLEDPNTGVERWRLPIPDPRGALAGMSRPPAILPDGRALVTTTEGLFAIQLDRLPPDGAYCLGTTCGNPRMDGAAVPFLR